MEKKLAKIFNVLDDYEMQKSANGIINIKYSNPLIKGPPSEDNLQYE